MSDAPWSGSHKSIMPIEATAATYPSPFTKKIKQIYLPLYIQGSVLFSFNIKVSFLDAQLTKELTYVCAKLALAESILAEIAFSSKWVL